MDFKLLFLFSLFTYLMVATYLVVRAMLEEPMKRYKIIVSFSAMMFSIYALAYYFERV